MSSIDSAGSPLPGGPLDPLLPLPLVAPELPRLAGVIKAEPEDFEVEEIPAYPPAGEGEFTFLWVEKRDLDGRGLLRRLADLLGIAENELGCAGTKDRRAVTRQWLSVPTRRLAKLDPLKLDLGPEVRVLETALHTNKLRTGHLKGNRFRLCLRDLAPSPEEALARAQAILAALEPGGLPNFFGPQRFGRDGETGRFGLALLAQGPRGVPRRYTRSPGLRRLLLSAGQSLLFNAHLRQRISDGLYGQVLQGDLLKRRDTGGLFTVSAEEFDAAKQRMAAGELVHTGPMFGHKMRPALDEAGRREASTLALAGIDLAALAAHKSLADGTRRPDQVFPEDLTLGLDGDTLRFEFTLPKGSYATVLMLQLLGAEPSSEDVGDDEND